MADESTADRYRERVPAPHRQPRYRAIADELRRRITAGAIPAGALIPSESSLTAEFRVARGTIREAINVLRAEGLVMTEHGRGTYARPNLPVRRLGPERYMSQRQQDGDETTGARSFRNSGVEQVNAEYQEVAATPELAEMFEVEPGTVLLQRRLLTSVYGVPQQLTTAYYLLDTVAGTPVADPNREPWPGGHVAQLQSLGILVTKIREVVQARMPTIDEAEALRLPAGVPVLIANRRTYADGRTVEVATSMVFPADRAELEYEIPADLT
ncbi:GntR family transcriptional regulator [Plantactinospora sp. B24E8]|uniref:GntR family transcriptional regulator n=1 Tax=Plantactinospora sp. B24E8 TaxID=3153567 RepID=UPI00325F38EF